MRTSARRSALRAMVVLTLAVASACASDDGNGGGQPIPTVTPTSPPEDHSEVLIGSTQAGSGDLKAEYEFEEPVHAHFSACLGGTGPECIGGTAVYSVVSPGFDSLEEDEPEASHFTLVDGTEITLRVISIDPGLSFKLGSLIIDAAGETVLLGAVPFHADIEAQVAVENGIVREGGWRITFDLTSSDSGYETSETYTLIYQLEDE